MEKRDVKPKVKRVLNIKKLPWAAIGATALCGLLLYGQVDAKIENEKEKAALLDAYVTSAQYDGFVRGEISRNYDLYKAGQITASQFGDRVQSLEQAPVQEAVFKLNADTESSERYEELTDEATATKNTILTAGAATGMTAFAIYSALKVAGTRDLVTTKKTGAPKTTPKTKELFDEFQA